MTDRTYSVSPAHYDDIPDEYLKGDKTVLEFGPASGINQLISRHRDFFIHNNKNNRYLGIELNITEDGFFNIEQGDIRFYQTTKQYDIVIALHVIEHIDLKYWSETIERLKSFVAPDGYLIIGTPNKEPAGLVKDHKVSMIDVDMLRTYLRGAEVHEMKTPPKFNENGANPVWAHARYIKRKLTRHPYVRRSGRLLAIWSKSPKRCCVFNLLGKDGEQTCPRCGATWNVEFIPKKKVEK